MSDYNKLELVKESLLGLLEHLSDKDRISIVRMPVHITFWQERIRRRPGPAEEDHRFRMPAVHQRRGDREAYRLAENTFENGVNGLSCAPTAT